MSVHEPYPHTLLQTCYRCRLARSVHRAVPFLSRSLIQNQVLKSLEVIYLDFFGHRCKLTWWDLLCLFDLFVVHFEHIGSESVWSIVLFSCAKTRVYTRHDAHLLYTTTVLYCTVLYLIRDGQLIWRLTYEAVNPQIACLIGREKCSREGEPIARLWKFL